LSLPWRKSRRTWSPKIPSEPSGNDLEQKTKKRNKNRFEVLSSLSDDIIQDHKSGIYFSKRNCVEVIPGKPVKAKQKLRGKKCYFNKRKRLSPADPVKDFKVPDTGPRPRWMPKSKKLDEFQKKKLLKDLLEMTKQSKNDFEKSKSIAVYLVGTIIHTRYVDITALPYVSVHPKGYVFVHKTPSLRAARTLLSQCLHVPSTFLEKVSRLQGVLLSIDRSRLISHTNLPVSWPERSPEALRSSSNEGKSMIFE
jgi:hypothetical protein